MSSRRINANDRLGITLVMASLLHAMAALGITFEGEPEQAGSSTLDVILVQTKSENAPEKADFLAQANSEGGGESEERLRPSDLFSAPVPKPEDGIAPVPMEETAPKPREEIQSDTEVLTTQIADTRVDVKQAQSAQPQEAVEKTAEERERELEMAKLQAEIERNRQAYAKRPKRKFISANTREDGYAQYMAAWVAKVERVGNLNYPDEAIRRDLLGSLVLSVAVRRDGTVEKVEIIQSSGEPVLDDSAVRIVQLAAPYSPFPNVPGEENYDVLHITRTWQYLPGNVLQSQ
jgi:periplasmic protein TonB